MERKVTLMVIAALVLAVSLVCPVNAGGGVFAVGPGQEVIEPLPNLQVGESAAGNVSADGCIDFRILDPSGAVLQCYNETSFTEFGFTANRNGNYTLHMVNNHESRVTVTLRYGINFVVVLQGNIGFQFTLPDVTVVPTQPSVWSLLWDSVKNWLPSVPILGALVKAIKSLIDWIEDFRRRRWWQKKYGKPRTPSTMGGSSG